MGSLLFNGFSYYGSETSVVLSWFVRVVSRFVAGESHLKNNLSSALLTQMTTHTAYSFNDR